MGPTWKSVVSAVVVGLAAICSAHGQPVPFIADADARACLMRSYSAMPSSSSRYVNPNDPRIAEAAGWREAAAPQGKLIVAYVVALESLLAAITVVACLLVLALAGFIVRRRQRPARAAVPAESSAPFVLVPETKLSI